jgi:hypothetical protein
VSRAAVAGSDAETTTAAVGTGANANSIVFSAVFTAA